MLSLPHRLHLIGRFLISVSGSNHSTVLLPHKGHRNRRRVVSTSLSIGLFFNVELPFNFNSPYKATSIMDFWDRWHITLTKFFTKYVYIPLGGNRRGTIRTYVNVWLVFLISGLWHGAAYTYIAWGMLNGIFMVLEQMTVNLRGKICAFFKVDKSRFSYRSLKRWR